MILDLVANLCYFGSVKKAEIVHRPFFLKWGELLLVHQVVKAQFH